MRPVLFRFVGVERTRKSAGSKDAISETGRGTSELLISLKARMPGFGSFEDAFGSVGEYAGTGTGGVESGIIG